MLPLLQDQFFTDLIMGALKEIAEIQKRIELIGLPVDIYSNPCCVINVHIPDFEQYIEEKWMYGKNGLNNALMNFFREENYPIRYFCINRSCGKWKLFAICMIPLTISELEAYVQRSLNDISNSIHKILGLQVKLSVKKYFSSIVEVSRCDGLPVMLSGDEYNIKDSSYMNPEISESLLDEYKLIVSNINEGNMEQVNNLFERVMKKLKPYPLNIVKQFIIKLFTDLMEHLRIADENMKDELLQQVEYNSIMAMGSFNDIHKYCKKCLMELVRISNRNIDVSIAKLIDNAKKYIMSNYQRDLTLDEVADKVYLNPVYFSRVFKQVTGENFIDFLTDIRMKKAMELIREGKHKIQDISKMVGYSNSKYFSRVFKQYTGCTPREYQRSLSYKG